MIREKVLTALVVLAILGGAVGCSTQPPSHDQVVEDAERLVNQTRLKKHFIGSKLREGKFFYLDGVSISGNAVEESVARVRSIVKVRYEDDSSPRGKEIYARHGSIGLVRGGFAAWVPDKVVNGATINFDVTFIYRDYDSGWQLESVE